MTGTFRRHRWEAVSRTPPRVPSYGPCFGGSGHFMPGAATDSTEQTVNILLVDDQPENLFALQSTLEGLGQNLLIAHSGREALRHLLVNDCALIILDVVMPG